VDDATAAMTPEERLAAGLCCECGMKLEGHHPDAHAATHWPVIITPTGFNQEAIRRQGLLLAYVPPPLARRGEFTERREHEERPSAGAGAGARTPYTPPEPKKS